MTPVSVEPQVCAALVRETSGKLQEILAALPLEFEPLIPGYRLKMLDGSLFGDNYFSL